MTKFDLKAVSVQGARIVGDLRAEMTAARRHLEPKRSPGSSLPLLSSNKRPNFTYLNASIFAPENSHWLLSFCLVFEFFFFRKPDGCIY